MECMLQKIQLWPGHDEEKFIVSGSDSPRNSLKFSVHFTHNDGRVWAELAGTLFHMAQFIAWVTWSREVVPLNGYLQWGVWFQQSGVTMSLLDVKLGGVLSRKNNLSLSVLVSFGSVSSMKLHNTAFQSMKTLARIYVLPIFRWVLHQMEIKLSLPTCYLIIDEINWSNNCNFSKLNMNLF